MSSHRPLIRRLARGLRPAILGPLRFAIDAGHLRSALLCQAVDRSGEPLPWITYPAIEFLAGLDWHGRRVLEWGAGNSTLWWSRQGAQVLSIEHSQPWIAELRGKLSPTPDVELRWASGADAYANAPRGGAPFELAVIDGEARFRCAQTALEVTAPSGGILLDNSEQTWAEPGQSGFPIIDLMRARGWLRIDFHGFAPSVARPHCTSLFFRPETTLFDRQSPPTRRRGIVPG
jgi:hypothetical protein